MSDEKTIPPVIPENKPNGKSPLTLVGGGDQSKADNISIAFQWEKNLKGLRLELNGEKQMSKKSLMEVLIGSSIGIASAVGFTKDEVKVILENALTVFDTVVTMPPGGAKQ